MSSLRIFSILISLLLLCGQSHASSECRPPSSNSGDIVIVPSSYGGEEQEETQSESGERFKSGTWLALACGGNDCRLEPVKLKVTTDRPNNKVTEVSGCNEQMLTWDLSSLDVGVNTIMFLKPSASIKAGTVKTWFARRVPSGLSDPVEAGTEMRIATPTSNNPSRTSILVPLEVTNEHCTEAQDANNECMRKRNRVQLREDKARQWMGPPLDEACLEIGGMNYPREDYLQWAGDLDNDQKPDYLLFLGEYGYVLFLSSRASSGNLVGEAGRYFWPYHPCD